MPVFGHLNRQPIRVWDESRTAINAQEMLGNGNWSVTYYKGEPDHWYTKPPLMVWCQTTLMKLIGVNELAVRLPSAIAALLTMLALLVFSVRHLKSSGFGFVVVMVLLTSEGYISIHGTRTGDTDALLTLFTTLIVLMFYVFEKKQQLKHLYLFFLFTTLAIFAKGVAGLLFMPALFIYWSHTLV